jgi:guanosine-3',5'-bis(diphosphate) 3'-pyrophosphohydrolase
MKNVIKAMTMKSVVKDRTLKAVVKATHFAANKHRNQRRKTLEAIPYINHPIDLAHLLVNEVGCYDENIVCAAILHDVLEDTKTSAEELVREFGPNVYSLVEAVTDDKSLDWKTRKELQVEKAKTASYAVAIIKLADKTCNLRDFQTYGTPNGWTRERVIEYFDWSYRVVSNLPHYDYAHYTKLRSKFEVAHSYKEEL